MPTFDHIDYWVFDLDNTLYPADSDVFPQIDARMRGYIERELDLPADQAWRLQKDYFHNYGTTLRGLMLHHGADPLAFLDYVHDIDFSAVPTAPFLAEGLSRLEGKKFIFTNGSEPYALKVLERLGLQHLFSGVFDIVSADYCPKPEPETYRRLVEQYDLDPARTVLFEDIPRNLVPAADLGMTTVWVRNDIHAVGEQIHDQRIDHITEDLTGWIQALLRRRADASGKHYDR